VLQRHLATFFGRLDDCGDPSAPQVPGFVRQELEDYLRCGQLAAGFGRVFCPGCKRDELVALSCKRRGFCPSCGGRRMADTAAWLVDRVFPDVPVRQFVLSLPFELRFPVARDPDLLGDLRRIFVRSCFALQRRQARRQGLEEARPAAVVSVQRFDSALRLNPHFHALFVDGVFTVPPGARRAVFHALPPPSDADLARVAARIFRRTLALLRERGLTGECGQGSLLDDEPTALDVCQQAAVQGRIAFGERAGCAVRRVGDEAARLAQEDRRDSGNAVVNHLPRRNGGR
jgi:hypothetical protein